MSRKVVDGVDAVFVEIVDKGLVAEVVGEGAGTAPYTTGSNLG